jgi:general secretion pathway protein C
LNFCTGFSTLRAVLRRAGLGQALKALHYCLIVLAAWAAAVVVVKLATIDLHPRLAATQKAEDPLAGQPHTRRGADDAEILKRNIFGAADVDVASDDGQAAGAGSVDLRLRGVASSHGSWFAVFENTGSGEQNVFAIGEKVFEGPKLVSVDTGGADVLQKGKKRRYEIIEDQDEAAADSAKDSKKGAHQAMKHAGPERPKDLKGKGKEKDKGGHKDDTAGVKKTGEGAYLVDRREIEHVVSNLNEVITEVRAVPVLDGGKSSGFKLFNIRRGSIFDKIGLLDGDIVQRVNDTELTDPSKAVGLLEDVQSMSQIRVGFVRGGKLHTQTYTIR